MPRNLFWLLDQTKQSINVVPLHHAILHHTDRNPGQLAFSCGSAHLSYEELVVGMHQLAGQLQDVGIVAGDRVAIWMPRCLESSVAVYGVLAAGAAFVPIDPDMPAAAVVALLADCNINTMISVPAMSARLTELVARPSGLRAVIGLDRPAPPEDDDTGALHWVSWPEVHDRQQRHQTPLLTDASLAYIIHTSGSTGKPKGIMHSHASGESYARLTTQTYGFSAEDRIGSHAPLHTDMCTLGYLSGPHAGATTILAPEAHTRMPASLSMLLESQAITVWYSVPLAIVQMLNQGALASRNLSALRWLLYGGEPFAPKYLQQLFELQPTLRVSNVYGPAETNQCTHFDLDASLFRQSFSAEGQAIPIGRVWDETHFMIVDENDQAVATGDIGELVVTSSTRMLGYWNRSDLNDAAWLRRSTDGVDFYRTGDLVRWSDDWGMLLVGRKDRQVKIRGFRVELDAVEHALAQHAEVSEAAAYTVGSDAGATSRLLAVVLPQEVSVVGDPEQSDRLLRELRQHLRTCLSGSAQPDELTLQVSLPRTTSGKVDRNELAATWTRNDNNEIAR